MDLELNNGFFDLTSNELEMVVGGADPWVVAGVVTLSVVAIACAPAAGVAMVTVGGCSVATGVGTALGLAGGGCLTIGAVNHAD